MCNLYKIDTAPFEELPWLLPAVPQHFVCRNILQGLVKIVGTLKFRKLNGNNFEVTYKNVAQITNNRNWFQFVQCIYLDETGVSKETARRTLLGKGVAAGGSLLPRVDARVAGRAAAAGSRAGRPCAAVI